LTYEEVKARAVATEQRVEVVPHCDAGQLFRGDVCGAETGERAGAEVRVGEEDEVGEGEAQGGVPEELEPLVRGGRRNSGAAAIGGLMRERLLQQGAVVELVTQQVLDARRRLSAVRHEPRRRQRNGAIRRPRGTRAAGTRRKAQQRSRRHRPIARFLEGGGRTIG
jgi:hypothetical protein